jgi:NAD-dependent deacetylase
MDCRLARSTIDRLQQVRNQGGNIVALTGAGISAESGIPTFRGKDGFWVVGSREYQPQEMATFAMFQKYPAQVWAWYLYRLGLCNEALPNAGHHAMVDLERQFGDRFQLITQNIDGLHLRAGNSEQRTFEIHGNIGYARCVNACGQNIWQLPPALGKKRDRHCLLSPDERNELHCPACKGWARPHVLWFDEYYDEEHFRFDSSIRAALTASLLLVVGTSGATNLPMQVGRYAADAGALIIDINIDANPFSHLAQIKGGYFLSGSSGAVLPEIVKALQ